MVGLCRFHGFYGVGCAVFLGTVSSNTMDGEVRSWSCEMEVGGARMAHDQRWVAKPRVAMSKLQPVVV
uniref:Uncharacterized protein n=1 Tax=Fagus sylvatica TaxID=28930 RepID=A0A2N9EIH1_FAGSY